MLLGERRRGTFRLQTSPDSGQPAQHRDPTQTQGIVQHSATATMTDRSTPAAGTALLQLIGLDGQHEPLLIIDLNFGHMHAWNVEHRIGSGAPAHTRTTHTVGRRRGLRQTAWSLLILKASTPSPHDQTRQPRATHPCSSAKNPIRSRFSPRASSKSNSSMLYGPEAARPRCCLRRRGHPGRRPRVPGRPLGIAHATRIRGEPVRRVGRLILAAWCLRPPGQIGDITGEISGACFAALAGPSLPRRLQGGAVVGQSALFGLGFGAGGTGGEPLLPQDLRSLRVGGSEIVWCRTQARSRSATSVLRLRFASDILRGS
jgi:hypothetical protein